MEHVVGAAQYCQLNGGTNSYDDTDDQEVNENRRQLFSHDRPSLKAEKGDLRIQGFCRLKGGEFRIQGFLDLKKRPR